MLENIIAPSHRGSTRHVALRKERLVVLKEFIDAQELMLDRTLWLEQLKRNSEFYTQTQNLYWQTTIENSAGNARKLWNTLSTVMGKKQKSIVQDGLDAESFLRCFEDKINDVRATTAGAADPDYSPFHGKPLTEFSAITVDDVQKTHPCGSK